MQLQTFNISLPRDLVLKADRVARKEYRNRSELIREALRTYLQEALEWEELFKFGKQQREKLGLENQKDIDRTVYQYRHRK